MQVIFAQHGLFTLHEEIQWADFVDALFFKVSSIPDIQIKFRHDVACKRAAFFRHRFNRRFQNSFRSESESAGSSSVPLHALPCKKIWGRKPPTSIDSLRPHSALGADHLLHRAFFHFSPHFQNDDFTVLFRRLISAMLPCSSMARTASIIVRQRPFTSSA